MSATRVPSGLEATWMLARLTWRRAWRGRWTRRLSLVAAGLPLAYTLLVGGRPGDEGWRHVFYLSLILLAVLPPLYLAPAVAEELEDRTYTYLWSRPVPRWSLVAGKLLALVPMCAAATTLALVAAYPVAAADPAGELGALAASIGAMTLGVLVIGMIALGLGSLTPRFALPVSIGYLLVLDLPLGTIPFSVRNLAVTEHVRRAAALRGESLEEALVAALSALLIGALWLAIALWRTTATESGPDR